MVVGSLERVVFISTVCFPHLKLSKKESAYTERWTQHSKSEFTPSTRGSISVSTGKGVSLHSSCSVSTCRRQGTFHCVQHLEEVEWRSIPGHLHLGHFAWSLCIWKYFMVIVEGATEKEITKSHTENRWRVCKKPFITKPHSKLLSGFSAFFTVHLPWEERFAKDSVYTPCI